MAGDIQRIETNYLSYLEAVPYFVSVKGASEIQPLLDFNNVDPTSAVVIFDGETPDPNTIISDDTTLQPSVMEWSVFLISPSYATDGEGRSGTTGIYQMCDDVLAALQGKTLSTAPDAKVEYAGLRRYTITENYLVYQMRFRNRYYRVSA